MTKDSESWPEIPFSEWQDTCLTLQLYTQVVGKVRLTLTPWINHSWQVVLYTTGRGLTTSPIPHPNQDFQMDFDFVDHELVIAAADGTLKRLKLRPQSVAAFYQEVMDTLKAMDLEVEIDTMPNEFPDPIPFDQDQSHDSYDAGAANRFWRALLSSHRVFTEFRSGYVGKVSPVHFFWGSFDLAVTRFSGRKAPLHPGGVPGLSDEVTREAYSHEVSSAGFWPGNGALGAPTYYSYAYPTPEGFGEFTIAPDSASFNKELGEFILPYDEVRKAIDPEATLLEFLESTYRAAAELAHWDRKNLECDRGRPGVPRPL